MMFRFVLAFVLGPLALAAGGQHAGHDMHAAGNRAMGFDQARAFHHFHLRPNGGIIEIHANDPSDAQTASQVAAHLEHIARSFADGNFDASIATHGEEPRGVGTLQRLKTDVRYTFRPSSVGGRVVISSERPEAVAAIHEFLRYQIREHHTGDSTDVEGERLR
jgi:hypothetical protein